MNEVIKCEKCGIYMNPIASKQVLAEVDFDELTEGQLADYLQAEITGDWGYWAITLILFVCKKCGHEEIIQCD